jgi:hypothetical protein
MGVSSSIQFRGLENALQAYINKDVQCWSIWQGKQMLDKGSDAPGLRAFLELLENSGSEAIYTVKVYEDITDPKKIKSTTADDGSFNFRLNEPNQLPTMFRGGGQSYSRSNDFENRFNELEEKISGLIAPPAVEEEEETLTTAVIGLLKDPDKLGKFIEVTRSLFAQPQPSYVGNVHRLSDGTENKAASLSPSSNSSAELSAEEKLTRLGKAIDTLEAADPGLVEHLEKLAKIAVENPRQFSQLISMIDVF